MTSATPLTEAEEIELERIKDRIDASICKFKRKLDADLDKIRRSLQDMCSTMETKDVSSGNCKSQLELPKFSDDGDFHKSSNVDRAIADEDLMEQHGSERYEEMDIELKMKIGVKDCTRVSTEMEDVEFLEEVTTPLQTKREMEIFMPMGKSTEVKKGRELEQNQLKQTECISHARQNVQVNELPMGLPISTHYSLPLSWLLNWFPRPTVKLKFVAQRDDELYEGFDDRSKVFVGYGECSIFDAIGRSVMWWKNGFTVVENQHDQMSGALWLLPGLFDGVLFRLEFGGNGDGSYPLGSIVLGISRGIQRSLVGSFLMQKLLEECNGEQNTHDTRMVQWCLQCFITEDSQFIFVAAIKYYLDMAMHQYECCVLHQFITRSIGEIHEKLATTNLVTNKEAIGLLLAPEAIGLKKQVDLDKAKLQGVMRWLDVDECEGVFEIANEAVIQTLCGLSEPRKKEMDISSSSTSLIQIVQMHLAASNLFENVEENVKSFDNPIEGVERVRWFLASSYASSRNYRSLKRLSIRFPKPMVKMKSMKHVGKARPKSWRWVNSDKCLLIMMRDQWLNCWMLDFFPSLRTRKL